MRRILSIDGGGVRGVIPALVLAALERSTGRPARESFDFIAGTSTGAVLAAGLAAGIPAERLVRIYVERAPELFRKIPLVSVLRRVISGSMYDTRTLNRIVREELGDAVGWRLNDAPVDMLITAKRLSDGMPWYFVRDNVANSCRAGDFRLADVVTASAAAPTYLEPWLLRPIGELVDGGTGVAGNPVYQACVEAFQYTDAYDPVDTIVVSLGTGRWLRTDRPRWLGAWLGWILTELLRSPSEQQTELVFRHYPATPLFRIDTALPREIPLDSVAGIGELRATGEALAAAVDWPAILDGRDDRFRITASTTLPREYCLLGPAPLGTNDP